MSDNYPDDIRNYDHDPRSPFHPEVRCTCCGEPCDYSGCLVDWCETDQVDLDGEGEPIYEDE